MTLIGQPETILEVDGGSIFIDFRRSTLQYSDNNTSPMGTQEQMVVPNTPVPEFGGASHFSSATAAEVLK